jgi:hypothetical protein
MPLAICAWKEPVSRSPITPSSVLVGNRYTRSTPMAMATAAWAAADRYIEPAQTHPRDDAGSSAIRLLANEEKKGMATHSSDGVV